MENASRALLMAAGVLIALMIAAVVVMMFTNLGDAHRAETDIVKSEQVAKFNSEFSPYIDKKLSLSDLKSIYNKIQSNNDKYKDEPAYRKYIIKTNIEEIFNSGEVTISGENAYKASAGKNAGNVSWTMFKDEFSDIADSYKNKLRINFYCKTDEVLYDGPDGRISQMNFAVKK